MFATEFTQINKNAYVALKGRYVFEPDAEVIVNLTIPDALQNDATVYLFGIIEGTPKQIGVFMGCSERKKIRVLSDLNAAVQVELITDSCNGTK